MKKRWMALGAAVVLLTAGITLAREPGRAAKLGFPVDRSGRIYKLDAGGPAGISVYDANLSSLAGEQPYATIAGSRTGLGETHTLALDPDGDVYVSQAGSILAFPANPSAGRHDEAPSAFIVGAKTDILQPKGMTFDRSARLYVADEAYQGVLIFAPHANGDVAPIAIIAGSHTGITYPQAVTLDADGNIYVAQLAPEGTETGAEILEFAASASGNATPIAKLAGAAARNSSVWPNMLTSIAIP